MLDRVTASASRVDGRRDVLSLLHRLADANIEPAR
jgi:hypothetical protein